jgi:hypothetical protein
VLQVASSTPVGIEENTSKRLFDFISLWVPQAWLDDASPWTLLDMESVVIVVSPCFKLARLARTLAACFAYFPRRKSFFMNSLCSGNLASASACRMISPSIFYEDVDAPGNKLLRSCHMVFSMETSKACLAAF